MQPTLEYVAHPINAYHLMKRTSTLWPTFFDDVPNDVYNDVEDVVEKFPFQSDFAYGATFGLLSIQVSSICNEKKCSKLSLCLLSLSLCVLRGDVVGEGESV
jgi:hypothetical protein